MISPYVYPGGTMKYLNDHADLEKLVETLTGISFDLMKGKSRKREIVEARHLAMYMEKKYTKSSLKSIGLKYGGRDHSTVIHSCNNITNLLFTEDHIKKWVERLDILIPSKIIQ